MATITVPILPPRGKKWPKGSTIALQSRQRKVAQSLDTRLDSYDRTDPFLAFNSLHQLIGSLSSRVGGRQYKLSQEEHRLSLHLLTIIEPFVGLSPSRRTITRQPTEILDSIVFYVDTKGDLLSLGLTCHRMHSIVFPRHYNYHTIRCKVSSISLWNHLIMHRSLARNVRRLEIIDERSTTSTIVPPDFLTSEADFESSNDALGLHARQERYLVSALHKMSALQSFSWSCNHSPISIDNVWPTLVKNQSLKEVEINDNLAFHSRAGEEIDGMDEEVPTGQLVRLPELKVAAVRSTGHIYGATRSPVLSRVSGMLNQCLKLESLDINYSHPRLAPGCLPPLADDFLLCSRWSHLTTLTLTNLRCSPVVGFSAVAAFLAAHVNLEVLDLDVSDGSRGVRGGCLTLPYGSLPLLRELKANQEITSAILNCQCDPPRPLDTLKGVPFPSSTTTDPGSDHASTFFQALKRGGQSLKRIELTGWYEMEDLQQLIDCAPRLTWLDIGKKKSGALPKDKTFHPVFNTMEWAILLSALPDLTTFHGVHFFYSVSDASISRSVDDLSTSDRSRIRKNDEIASVLAWKCRKLRRVDHWEEGTGRVIALVRDAGGHGHGVADKAKVKWEVRRVRV